MGELVGNKAIEQAAIAWVMELERRVGREPRDTASPTRRQTSRARRG